MTEEAPLPSPSPDSLPYWDGLREGRLRLQRCAACGLVRHYPRPVCAACYSMDVDWIDASGRGTVHSWTETHHAFLPTLRDAVPYVLLTVDLPEGVRMLAQLRGDATGLRPGAAVECRFEALGEWTVPVFALTQG